MLEASSTNRSNEVGHNGNVDNTNQQVVKKRRGSEYVDLLLQRLQTVDGLEHSPVIGITSPHARQGVSTLATNLSIRAADHFAEPVLLVDCNYNNQRTSRMYRATGNGFGECYGGTASIGQCVRKTNVTNLNVLGIGKSKLARQIIVDLDVISNFVKEMRNSFRFSVLDLPTKSDASAMDGLIPHLDGVFIVSNYGTHKRVLEETITSITEVGGRVLGIVMTGDESKVPRWVPSFLR